MPASSGLTTRHHLSVVGTGKPTPLFLGVKIVAVTLSTVQRVTCLALGSPLNLRLEDVDPPWPGDNEVLVEVKAAGANYVDALMARGGYQAKPKVPYVPGGELAGIVAAVGARVDQFKVGDRVMALCNTGAFAGQAVLKPAMVTPVPDGLTLAQAAAMQQSYLTALFTLTNRTRLVPGESVLVLGAGGGVGLACVDVAVALGARVIAAASSEDKRARAMAAGAWATISYDEEDLKIRARELSDGGVDVIVDPVGGPAAEQALRAGCFLSRYLVVGFASEVIPRFPLNQVLLNNRTVIGVEFGAWCRREPVGERALRDELFAMAQDDRIHPPHPTEEPLARAADVLEAYLQRRVTGRVVLVPGA
jgi:NADPH2:quinone reductase